MKILTILTFLIIGATQIYAQNFPFPQNTTNSYGIMPSNRNHNDVDTAYSNWKNKHITSQGAGGYRRVIWDTLNATVSEGIAYGMLISVNMNDKALFDDLWNFYAVHRDPNGLMYWILDSLGNPLVINGILVGAGGATDADQDAAYALTLANVQWGSAGTINYSSESITLINNIYQYEIDSTYHLIKSGDEPYPIYRVNCSYFATAYYKVFKYVTGNSGWDIVAAACYGFLNSINNSTTGLVPDWCLPNGAPMPPCTPPYSCRYTYFYDATRTPMRIAMDYIWNGEPIAYAYCKKVSTFARSQGASNITDEYDLSGNPIGSYHNNAFIGPFAAGTLATDASLQNFADSIYSENVSVYSSRYNYYNSSIKLLSLLMMTGNFIKEQYLLPVNLLSFTSIANKNEVQLNWIVNSEQNNSGFEIERENNNSWSKVGYVEGRGTSNLVTHYTFSDSKLNSGKYKYRLKQIDFNGSFRYYELSNEVVIGIPITTKLFQNYPNPFNPSTTITFQLANTGHVKLELYDVSGRRVMDVIDGNLEAGYRTFNLNLQGFASGIYYYVLRTDEVVESKKLMLVK